MEINDLFKQSHADTGERKIILPVIENLYAKPLVYALKHNLLAHNFLLREFNAELCTEKLVQGESELALIPSIGYSRGKGSWKIIPDIAVSCTGPAGIPALFFNRDLRKIRKIAFNEDSLTCVALLKIILSERYELEPEYISLSAGLDQMLKEADAALVCKDEGLAYMKDYPAYIDLGEEWHDMTGLPFVFAFWAGHELSLTSAEVEIIKESCRLGKNKIDDICREQKAERSACKSYLSEHITSTFDKMEREGLKEFYRYAFYYGLIEHIPELHFFE